MTENNPSNLTKEQAVLLASQIRRGIVTQDAVEPLKLQAVTLKEENKPVFSLPESDEHTAMIRAAMTEIKTPEYIYVDICYKLSAFDISNGSTWKETVRLKALKAEYEEKFPYLLNSKKVQAAIAKRVRG